MNDRPVATFRRVHGGYTLVLGRSAIKTLEHGDRFMASIGTQVVDISLIDEAEDAQAREALNRMVEVARRLRNGLG